MPTMLTEGESQDELNHIFRTLWDVHSNSPFYVNVASSRKFRRNLKSIFVSDVIWMDDDDIKKQFSASDVEARKVRAVCCYFYYLQCKKVKFTRFSNFDKRITMISHLIQKCCASWTSISQTGCVTISTHPSMSLNHLAQMSLKTIVNLKMK